jgi:hypothetical protein
MDFLPAFDTSKMPTLAERAAQARELVAAQRAQDAARIAAERGLNPAIEALDAAKLTGDRGAYQRANAAFLQGVAKMDAVVPAVGQAAPVAAPTRGELPAVGVSAFDSYVPAPGFENVRAMGRMMRQEAAAPRAAAAPAAREEVVLSPREWNYLAGAAPKPTTAMDQQARRYMQLVEQRALATAEDPNATVEQKLEARDQLTRAYLLFRNANAYLADRQQPNGLGD